MMKVTNIYLVCHHLIILCVSTTPPPSLGGILVLHVLAHHIVANWTYFLPLKGQISYLRHFREIICTKKRRFLAFFGIFGKACHLRASIWGVDDLKIHNHDKNS